MITPVGAQRAQRKQRTQRKCRKLRGLPSAVTVAAILWQATPAAHDLERTSVVLTFESDGSYLLEVANDPNWLKLRLESFPGPFIDRIVMWVDGREIRPASLEFVPGAPAIHRMRGRMPTSVRTLRWYYGLVGDPYPLTVRRADGRVIVEEVGGDAWSREIDLSGQVRAPIVDPRIVMIVIAGLLAVPIALRIRSVRLADRIRSVRLQADRGRPG